MEVELRQVILCIETGCIVCNYTGQLIFASSHGFAQCSLLGACKLLDLKQRRQPIYYSAIAEDRQALWLWQNHFFQWASSRVFWVADVVVRGSLPRVVTDIPSQQEAWPRSVCRVA